jgi:hypothetical protein
MIFGMTSFSAQSQNWKTESKNTRQYGMVYAAYTLSKSDPNVSLGVACISGQRNATVYIRTSSSIVGAPSAIEPSIISVGRGRVDERKDNSSIHQATVTEDGIGLYLGSGIEGAGMTELMKFNDWMVVSWNYSAPSRPNWMRNLLGPPLSEPRQKHQFDLTGFAQATNIMDRACNW